MQGHQQKAQDLNPKWQEVEDLPKKETSCQCIDELFEYIQRKIYSTEVV